MTERNNSPFATGLLNSAPTQTKMANAAKQLDKIHQQQASKAAKQEKQQRVEQQIASVGKPFWWMLTMFICAVIYLFPEAVFNVALTDVAGGRNSTEADLRAVELFGRTISGIGVTLLLADLLLSGRRVANISRAFGYFIVIALLVWPTVFFGQKWLVERFIVDASTPSERQQAYLSQVLRSALIEKSIQFEGIDYDPDKPHSSLEKTFLSVFGGLVYADGKLVADLSQKKRMIVEKFVRDRALSHFDQYYQDYDHFRQTLRKQYQEYADGSAKYNQALNSVPARTDEYWLEVQNDVKQGWGKYQQGVKAYEARVESRAQKIAPKLYDYFERRNKCADKKAGNSRDRCFERVQTAYDREIKKYSIPYIPPDDWLIRKTVSTSENMGNSLIAGVMTLGVSTALQAVNAIGGGDGGFKDYRMVYTDDVNHYKQVLMVKMAPSFIQDSGGYPLGIDSLHTFRVHELTSVKVNKALKSEGIVLPVSWTILDRNTFDKAVAAKVRRQADTAWRNKIREKNSTLPPNLSWEQFQREEDIQQRIAQKMGDLYINQTSADWNNRQFKQYIMEPNIQRKTTEYLTILEAQQVEFADGGTYENAGKSALRATVIPPISMSISLALVLLTILKLPIKFVELIQAKRATPAIAKAKKVFIKPAISFTLIVLIFIVPLSIGSNQYTMKTSSMNYFFDQMEKNDAASISFALKWLLITQPLVQPVGAFIDDNLGITQGFHAISAPLNRFDLALMPEHDAARSSSVNSSPTIQQLPLTVYVNVPNASISVMNIKPKYQAGMLLPPGRYDIKITAPGHQELRQWVFLQADKTQFNFQL